MGNHMRGGSKPSPIAPRFQRSWILDSATECWEWQKAKTDRGYGVIRWNGRQWRANRVSYVLHKGEIPEGMVVMHKCDNPACVNPEHLSLGTNKSNSVDMVQKGRQASVLTEAQVRGIRADARSNRVIAEEFGIDKSQVCCIKNNKRWLHIQ